MKKKAWKSISAVFMAICMAITMSSTSLFMVVADALETQQESSVDSTEASTEETSSEESEEKVSTDYLKAINVKVNGEIVNLLTTSSEDRIYKTTLPADKTSISVGAELSESAPEGSTITVYYYSYSTQKDATKILSSSATKTSSISGIAEKCKNPVAFKIVVGVEGNTQEYTVNVARTPVINSVTFTDIDGEALVKIGDEYLVPKGTEFVKINVKCFDANLTINGNSATSEEEYSFKPVFNDDDICEVIIKAYHDESDAVTKTYKIKQYDSMSGTCGENVNWLLKDGVLTISGNGSMDDYTSGSKPSYMTFANSIKSVVFESGVTSVGNYAFYKCTKLKKVTFSDTVKNIGNYAFSGCIGIKIVELPEGVTSLSSNAFSGCTALESVSIPSTLTDFNKYQFKDCTNLNEIKISGSNYKFENNIVYTADGKKLVFCLDSYVGSLKVPETVTEINDGAFLNCKYLTAITLPESLTKIGSDAFNGCLNLTNITIPKNVTELGGFVFYGCTGLEDVVISGNVTSIGFREFGRCSSLKNVTLPSTVESIGNYAFEYCTSLTKLDLPDGLTSLGNYVFQNCSILEDIQLPSSIRTLGNSCFLNCYALKNIEIPEGVNSIPMLFLSGCRGLETVIIPKSVTTINSSAFPTMQFIYYRGSEEEWNAIEGSGKPSSTASTIIVYNYSKIGDSADAPVITEQPQDKVFAQNEDATNALKVKVGALKEGEKIYITWYSNSKNSTTGGTKVLGTIDEEDDLTSYVTPSTETIGNKYYYCSVVKVTKDGTVTMTTSDTAVVAVRMNDTFSGNGTQKEPYLINSIEDLQTLYNLVSEGKNLDGMHFKLTADITLPADWNPIGVLKQGTTSPSDGKNILPFSGILDGDNHTINVARGGQPLFGYVRGATVKNLNIYGEYIAEEGLVANYVVDYGASGSYSSSGLNTIDITNVTIKSGTTIKGSGLIGGYASGANTVNITDCTVESGVKVGWDADKNESAGQNKIGSLAGEFNGTISNCVSNADVYGVDNVGGLMARKGQSMGLCVVKDSQFNGTVHATGNYVGGIVGSGYASESAPNTPGTTIENCVVTGTVNGVNYVGGIFGGEILQEQAWDNCYVRNNYFKGKINATGDYVGGVIGYMRSLNRYNVIENNYYIASCGANKGIGGALYVDTSAKPHGWTSDKATYYMNTSVDDISTIKQETNPDSSFVNIPKTNHNRSDDPLGADTEKLAKPMNAMITVTFEYGDSKITKIVDQDEKLDYTPEAPTKEGYTFVGWYKDVDDITTAYQSGSTYTENVTYKAKWAHVQMLGAQGKLVVDGKSGIRFGTKLYNDGDEIVEKGTLIIPANLLEEGEALTLNTKKAARSIGKVNYEVNEEENYVTYLGTIINIPNTQFDRQMTAAAYVIYKDKVGNEYTVYSQYPNASTSVYKLLENNVDWNEQW